MSEEGPVPGAGPDDPPTPGVGPAASRGPMLGSAPRGKAGIPRPRIDTESEVETEEGETPSTPVTPAHAPPSPTSSMGSVLSPHLGSTRSIGSQEPSSRAAVAPCVLPFEEDSPSYRAAIERVFGSSEQLAGQLESIASIVEEYRRQGTGMGEACDTLCDLLASEASPDEEVDEGEEAWAKGRSVLAGTCCVFSMCG
jgi:hypothetical protein